MVESAPQQERAAGDLELMLSSGERLRVSSGVDGATLRTVLEPCADDSPAGQRACLPVPDSLRYAEELRWAARAGARLSRTGCLRRAPVRVRQPEAGSNHIPHTDWVLLLSNTV